MSQIIHQPACELSAIEGCQWIMQRIEQRLARVPHDVWFVAVAMILAWASFQFGERIAIRAGLGFEGENFSNWVRDFHYEAVEVGVDAYCIQRVLPAATLHFVFEWLHIRNSTANILRGYATFNVISVGLIAGFWCATANRLRISWRGKCLGFIGLFLNYAVLKGSGYNVVMNDLPACATGSAMIYCYLTGRRWGIWLTTIIGALLWPTVIYFGTLLAILMPVSQSAQPVAAESRVISIGRPRGAPFRLDFLLAGLAAYAWCLWAMYSCERITIPLWGALFPIGPVMLLSLGLSALYVFFGLRPLLADRQLYRWPIRPSQAWLIGAAGSLAVALGIKLALYAATNRPGFMGLPVYAFTIGIIAVAKPGLFFVSHIVYFGPFWLLAYFNWSRICRAVRAQNGLGLKLVAMISVCHSLDGESRHLICFLPMIIPFVVQALDETTWTTRRLTLLAGLSVLASKVWLVVGGPFADNANAYPDQFYWMNIGSFMSDNSYLIQSFAIMICTYLTYRLNFPAAVDRAIADRTSGDSNPVRSILETHYGA